jgi:tetraacyldisaccharide 4'-kinase
MSRWQQAFLALAHPASQAYGAALRIRAQAYRRGLLRSWRPPVPCISVGNIRLGGTGKTPMVAWLLTWAKEQGLTPLVLTRGYRSRPPFLPYPVTPASPVDEAGDEPLLLAQHAPWARIIVDPNRVRAGRKALAENPFDIIILDDGFQHLRVQRDIDLCLLAPSDLDADWNRVLPAGPWREDASALARAHAFLVGCEAVDEEMLDVLSRLRLGTQRPIYRVEFRIPAARQMHGTEKRTRLHNTRALLVTGVARPGRVWRLLQRDLGVHPLGHLTFPDHHPFSASDWQYIQETATRLHAEIILATGKDAVKLAPLADERLWILDLTVDFSPITAHPPFPQWITERWRAQEHT